ncbi:hypothetical protein D3C76_1509310 [compost metagenome]
MLVPIFFNVAALLSVNSRTVLAVVPTDAPTLIGNRSNNPPVYFVALGCALITFEFPLSPASLLLVTT